jgi:hypothetical protein
LLRLFQNLKEAIKEKIMRKGDEGCPAFS